MHDDYLRRELINHRRSVSKAEMMMQLAMGM